MDVTSLLDILPSDTREPLEAAMAATSNQAERIETLRSNLLAMLSSSPQHAGLILGLKRKRAKERLECKKRALAAATASKSTSVQVKFVDKALPPLPAEELAESDARRR